MRAGTLTEVIEIWEPTIVVNDYGEQSTTYTLKYTTRARLIHKGGSRGFINDELFYPYTKEFAVRSYVPVTELDRIKWNNQEYKILDITPDKPLQQIVINCELIND